MLSTLSIENFAIVAHLELDFSLGMTALTGETGAGKSIMIDALMLVMGGRADASVVRPGCDKCEIHAHFIFDADSEPDRWLKEHDLGTDVLEVWLRRVISAEGRSKSYINGQPVPLQKVKELSEYLVDIHGQHEHQRLLAHQTHREQLDQYASHPKLLTEVYYLYHECMQLKQQQAELEHAGDHRERSELLNYQIEELTRLNPHAEEVVQLHHEHQLLHHAKDYLIQADLIKTTLTGGEEIPGVCQQLHTLLNMTHTLPSTHKRIQNIRELIHHARIQCDEALDEIEHFATEVQLDPERLQIVETRMSDLHQAARKYHIAPQDLSTYLNNLKQELEHLAEGQTRLKQIKIAYEAQKAAYDEAALRLRASRAQHTQELAKEITKTIRQLGMPQGYIDIKISSLDTPHPHGLDKVEYYVCTNPGLAPDILSKVASGGELSRISLAIQLITAQKRAATPTLIFDEVDVGIGGSTAALVGKLLRKLGQHLQVFCVTHQPQVAAAAHHHYRVEKYIKDEQTFSQISSLSATHRIEEIARMLGGLTITEQTRSHAAALLLENHLIEEKA